VHVEDQVRRAAVEIGHFDESAAGAVGDESACGGEVCAWKQDFVAGCACFADGCYGFLDGCGPGVDVEVVLDRFALVSHFGLLELILCLQAHSSDQKQSCCCPCTWPRSVTKG